MGLGNNGYIGRSPGDSSVIVRRQVYQPTGVQTSFTFESGYDNNFFDVFINGAKQIKSIDFTAVDNTTFSLTTPAQNGDVIEAVAYKAFNATNSGVGIQSAGVRIGEPSTLNFIGVGNTFKVRDAGEVIDISIQGGGGGGGVGTAINYENGDSSPFSYINATAYVNQDIVLDTTTAGADNSYVVVQEPRLVVSVGAAVTVGLGKTMVTDLYQLGDL
tara:strand:- start:33387 stop:34034 length:648 start_codon:yes stop_codon:yes gene_type:complete